MKNYRSQTVRATGWVLGSRFASHLISFGFGIALARLLVPDDFGLIAMVMVFARLAGLFTDVGLGSALVQKKDVRKEHFSSVFFLNILMGGSLGLTLFIISPWLSVFYERTEAEYICKALSIGFLIGSLALVPQTRLAKNLLFKYITFSNLVALIISSSIAVGLAAAGFGYWSLVAQILSQQFISTALLWIISGWRPMGGFSYTAIRELLGFSVSVFATEMLQYIAANIDKLLLGKYLGGQPLGIYDKAHSIMLFPLQNISRGVGSVMFPSLSLIQSETKRVRDIYLRSTRAIALLTFPMMAGMFVVAESFVLGVLGPQWSELIPVLKIFTVAGVLRSITTVTGSLYKSQGAATLQLRVNMILVPIRITGVVIGMQWGMIGVASGFTAATFVTSLITLTVAGRLVDLRLYSLIQSLLPVLMAAVMMALVIWVIRPVTGIQSELLLLFMQIFAGFFVYLVSVVVMKLNAYQDVAVVLREEFHLLRKKDDSSANRQANS